MCVVRFGVMSDILDSASVGMKFQLSNTEFVLLLFVAIALTAAGNVINDYFDQKVDRINKPDEVIVGKTVKRRVAIVMHQVLNFLAIMFSTILSFKTSYWWPMLLTIFIATILWWYSPVFKKKVFIGNFIVALCTASVPIWTAIYEIDALQNYYADMLIKSEVFFKKLWIVILIISAFAFLLTLIREAIKDMQDMQGDILGEYNTLPIAYGVAKTKVYVFVLMFLFMLGIFFAASHMQTVTNQAMLSASLIIPAIFTSWKIRKAETSVDFSACSRYIKLIVVIGLLMLTIIPW